MEEKLKHAAEEGVLESVAMVKVENEAEAVVTVKEVAEEQ